MADSRLPAAQRKAVVRRAAGCCEYCLSQERFSPDTYSVEHITPRARGGTDDPENLALACQGCNNRKYANTEWIDPIGGDVVPLFHPRRQPWKEHFAWSEDFTMIVGLTPTGRATVERLQLNRDGVVNLRRVLAAVGRHPPPRVNE